MEKLTRYRTAAVAATLSAAALTGCTIDSYLTDASDVQCDGKRTKADLPEGGTTVFIVHGSEAGRIATMHIKRDQQGASVKVEGDSEGALEVALAPDGYTEPVPVTEGTELSAFGAGGAWVIDVRETDVVIQGSCGGL